MVQFHIATLCYHDIPVYKWGGDSLMVEHNPVLFLRKGLNENQMYL
jgi:hypothetical protein